MEIASYLPVRHQLPHSGNHPLWRQLWSRIKLTMRFLTRRQDFHVRATDINHQDFHDGDSVGGCSLCGFVSVCRPAKNRSIT